MGVPKVSVVMPVYNAERYLREAVESVLGQTFGDWELVAVDDGSTDGSLAILREYERRDPRVTVFSRPNTGASGARNDGLAAARGEFVAFLDADDLCEPRRLEVQLEYMATHPEVVGVGSWHVAMDGDGLPLHRFSPPTDHDEIDRNHFEVGRTSICQSTLMCRKEAVHQLGGFRSGFEPVEDYDFWLRLAEVGRLANIAEPLVRYRTHLASISHKKAHVMAGLSQRVNEEASERRGRQSGANFNVTSATEPDVFDTLQRWAWWAWLDGFPRAARKYARRAVLAGPLRWQAWKLLMVTHLKHPLKVAE